MAQAFEIGVVMAGAVSAGAYTAGAMDFLFEALDAYYEARKQPDWDGPRHDVRIPIMTGASAGGMTAAIAALHAFRELEPVRCGAPPPAPERNRLYSSWVTDISLDRLLETADLTGERRNEGLQSALCCDVLDEIVAHAFAIDGPPKPREWIGREGDPTLRLRLTLTNTRGVPYAFPLSGERSPEKFGMLNHADFQEFVVGSGEALKRAVSNGATPLDAADLKAPDWALLRNAALATGAFPVGLRPRVIHREDTSFYFENGCVGYETFDNHPAFVPLPPDEAFRKVKPYAFVSVDGGTIDNEPLELARRYLSGGPMKRNDPNGVSADKAVVLIAPFPSLVQTPPPNNDLSLLKVMASLSSSLIQQARFKPDELHKAADDKVFSRFMIAPKRNGNHSEAAEKYPIACGVMGGFGGFLHESFRRHDYLLGRRNAQAFLRWTFALPKDNPLFHGVPIDPKWFVRDPKREDGGEGLSMLAPTLADDPPQHGYPIIPLTEALLAPIEIGEIDMPTPDEASRDDIKRRVGTRAKAVLETLVDQDLPRLFPSLNALADIAIKFGAREFGAHIATEFALKQIETALDEVGAAFLPL